MSTPVTHRPLDPSTDRSPDRAATGSPWRVVAAREILVKLRDKNFLLSTALTLVLMIGAFAFSYFMSTKTSHETVAVADDAGAAIVRTAGETGGDSPGKTEFTVTRVADAAAVEEAVRSGDADAGLVRTDRGWTLIGDEGIDSSVAGPVRAAVQATTMDANARAAGTTITELSRGTEVEERALDPSGADEGVTAIAGIAFAMLFYMAAILFGYSIANSVVEEKQSRIVEIIAAAIPLRQLLVGKVVGATVLAVGQLALFVSIALVGVSFTEYSSILPTIGAAAGWYLALFVVGFVAMASLFAVSGAMATRTEDVQSTSSPLLMLVLVGAFGSMAASGTVLTVLSYVPVASTVAMPVRLVRGEADWWEPVLALVVALAVTALVIGLAERTYRRSLLQTGGSLGWRQAMALTD